MNILICAYRDWAIKVFDTIKNCCHCDVSLATTPKQLLEECVDNNYDVIVLVGWSWKVPDELCDKFLIVGMHPSDLPAFAGGSPIQNQILAGVTNTKATLFRITKNIDAGDILDKEDISLDGHLDDVFVDITRATIALVTRFIERYPNVTFLNQTGHGSNHKRLKSTDSRLSVNSYKGSTMTAKQLWDFVRCHEDPYPNAYVEDDTGKLIIKRVEFFPKK